MTVGDDDDDSAIYTSGVALCLCAVSPIPEDAGHGVRMFSFVDKFNLPISGDLRVCMVP